MDASLLTRAEWRRATLLFAVVAGLHVLGFALLGSGALALGLGVTAYTLGVRHAFDADHLAAIDNTTRKLMAEGQRPLSVGFFFSLGHSTIVFALGVLVVTGVHGLGDSATLDRIGVIGPTVSGTFLVAIGLLNLPLLARTLRGGEAAPAGGVMTRLFARATRAVRRPWHMYPLGCLFGLGFDTATEVALLMLAGAGAASGLPVYALLCLPVLFAAGMSLFDTLDGAFMRFAYDWSLGTPARRRVYDLAITGLSVAVALAVGGLELLGVWGVVGEVDLNMVGYVVFGALALTWAVAVGVRRLEPR